MNVISKTKRASKIKAILAMLTIATMILANRTTVHAATFPDISDGTYTLSASLKCYVPAMGGIEFGGPLLKSVKVVISGGEAVMTVNLQKSNVTIYGVTCDTFISASTGTLGYYNKNGSLQTDVNKTISSDTVKDGANNDVNYVTSISFPLDQESETYKLALYVDSNVMGTQFGADGNYNATLTVDWSSVPRIDTSTENNANQNKVDSTTSATQTGGSDSSNSNSSNSNSSDNGSTGNSQSSTSNSGSSNNNATGSSSSNNSSSGNSTPNGSSSNNNSTGSSSSNNSASSNSSTGNSGSSSSNNSASNNDTTGNDSSDNTASNSESTDTTEGLTETELIAEETETTEEVLEKDGLNIHYAGTELEEETEEPTEEQDNTDGNGGVVTGIIIAIAAAGGIAGYVISKKKKG